MCGIVGWHSAQDGEQDSLLLKSMLSALVHRGPDDEGQYMDAPVALGVRRLSIIDVQGGHQPIPSEDRTVWAVLNGEIYNFQELRAELEAKGHVFATRSDTEVIVHGYEEWGDECVARLNGIFGLAVWDSRRRRLLLARDHFGVKPLYYYDDGRRLTWASEIKAILTDPTIPRRVDLDAPAERVRQLAEEALEAEPDPTAADTLVIQVRFPTGDPTLVRLRVEPRDGAAEFRYF